MKADWLLVALLVAGCGGNDDGASSGRVDGGGGRLDGGHAGSGGADAGAGGQGGTAEAGPPDAGGGPALARKKYLSMNVILPGISAPSATFVRQHIAEMEQRPFDGIIFNSSATHDFLSAFDATPWTNATILRDDLVSIPFSKFTDNFVAILATNYAGINWQSDSDWNTITANLGLLAAALRDAKLEGVLFDPEPYSDPDTWHYLPERFGGASFSDVQALFRKRGSQFMTALQTPMPNVKILSLFFLRMSHDLVVAAGGSLSDSKYGLLNGFLAGMLDGVGPEAEIIDGNENAYYYASTAQFFDQYNYLKDPVALYQKNGLPGAFDGFADAAAIEEKYRERIKIGMTMYVEQPSHEGWDANKYWEHNSYFALATSDEYVWCYSETVDWYNQANGSVPPALVDAITSARTKIQNFEPLGYELEPDVSAVPSLPISITAPARDSQFDPSATIPIQVDVGGAGSVDSVRFYANGWLLGSSSAPPYSFTVNDLPAGGFWLLARGSGPNGHGSSGAVPIVVRP